VLGRVWWASDLAPAFEPKMVPLTPITGHATSCGRNEIAMEKRRSVFSDL